MSSIKLLTFTTLYPNTEQPVRGIFVEQRLRQLLTPGSVQAKVVAPVPWFPLKHAAFGRYGAVARVPLSEHRNGISVLHPRYPVIPKIGMSVAPFLLAAAVRSSLLGLLNNGYDFDIIDAHYFYPDGVAAALLAKTLSKPVVITARGSDINLIAHYHLPRKMILWAARTASANITVSGPLKDSLVDMGVPEDDVIVLRNGVDLKLFYPEDRERCRRTLGLKHTTLLAVGQLIESKGHDIVLKALPKLPRTDLVIAGEGAAEGRLRTLAKSLGVADRVTFVGTVLHEQLKTYYSAADALVLASVREGWPNVLLESMACGTPVIASDVGSIRQIVAAPEAGVVMRARTPEGLVDAFHTLFSSYPDRVAIRRYAERFSWNDTAESQKQLFERIKARHAPA
jgi:glycosyltransferase involved in cell wall biosynthesis